MTPTVAWWILAAHCRLAFALVVSFGYIRSPHAEGIGESRFAVAVDTPISWANGSFAVSAYYAVTQHQVLRLNVAAYSAAPALAVQYLALDAGGDVPATSGYTSDVSVGWSYFTRRAYDGLSIELAGLGRLRRSSDNSSTDSPNEALHTQTQVLGGRALVGWSWMLFHRAFISVAAGASGGYEWGATNLYGDPMYPTVTARISRFDPEFECFMRLGTTFDL